MNAAVAGNHKSATLRHSHMSTAMTKCLAMISILAGAALLVGGDNLRTETPQAGATVMWLAGEPPMAPDPVADTQKQGAADFGWRSASKADSLGAAKVVYQ